MLNRDMRKKKIECDCGCHCEEDHGCVKKGCDVDCQNFDNCILLKSPKLQECTCNYQGHWGNPLGCPMHDPNISTPTPEPWEKKAQKWMDSLNILDVVMLDDIVRYRLAQQRLSYIEKIKIPSKIRQGIPAGEYEDGFDYGYDTKRDEVLELLEGEE